MTDAETSMLRWLARGLYIDEMHATLNRIEQKLNLVLHLEVHEVAAIEDMTAEVAENTDVSQSAITLLNGLKAALDAAIASGDMAAVQELADDLAANNDALSAAVAANTPSTPPA